MSLFLKPWPRQTIWKRNDDDFNNPNPNIQFKLFNCLSHLIFLLFRLVKLKVSRLTLSLSGLVSDMGVSPVLASLPPEVRPGAGSVPQLVQPRADLVPLPHHPRGRQHGRRGPHLHLSRWVQGELEGGGNLLKQRIKDLITTKYKVHV